MSKTVEPQQSVTEEPNPAAFIGRDEIMQGLEERDPHCIIPDTGYVIQHFDDAVFQSSDAGAMTADFVIVTRNSKPNRHGNQVQILPGPNGKGIITDSYAKNPVVLYEHGLAGLMLPVGQSQAPSGELSLKMTANKVVATCYFSKLPHAEPIFAAVNERLLRMASISYIATKAMSLDVSQEKLAAGVEAWRQWRGYDFVESEMTEWSVTAIGADRGSLRQALERGKIHDVKIPMYLRQSWQQHAEQKQAVGRGWTPSGTTDTQQPSSLGVLFQGLTWEQCVEKIRDGVQQANQLHAQDAKAAAVFSGVLKSIEQSTAAKVEPPAAAPSTPEPVGLTPEQIREQITQALANTQSVEKAAIEFRQSIEGIATDLSKTIQNAFAPIRDQQKEIEQRLKTITGKLD